jgi:hypothetical protein
MDRIISLLAALVGLIALGGALLVHVNTDQRQAQMAAEIAELKATAGVASSSSAPLQVATAEPPSIHIPSAERLAASSAAVSPATAAEPAARSSKALVPLPPLTGAVSEPVPGSVASAPVSSSVAPQGINDVGAQLSAMQSRIAELEQSNKDQASQLAAAQAALTARPVSSGPAGPSFETPAATAELTTPEGGPPVHVDPTVPPKVVAADGPTKDCIPLGTRFMASAGDSFPLCKTEMVLKVAAVLDGVATVTGAGDVAAGASVPYGNGCLLAVFSADTTGYAEMRVSCQ